jgi:hypothetical protein
MMVSDMEVIALTAILIYVSTAVPKGLGKPVR